MIAGDLGDDGAETLFGTAETLLDQAMEAGGNRVIVGEPCRPAEESLDAARIAVDAGHAEALPPQRLVRIARRLLPLLRLLDRKLGLGLPLDDMVRRLDEI